MGSRGVGSGNKSGVGYSLLWDTYSPLWIVLGTGMWQILFPSKIELTLLWLPVTLDRTHTESCLMWVWGQFFSNCISKGSAIMCFTSQKLLSFGRSATFASMPFYCYLCLVTWYWLLWSCLVTLWIITATTKIVPWYHISQAKFSVPPIFPSSTLLQVEYVEPSLYLKSRCPGDEVWEKHILPFK